MMKEKVFYQVAEGNWAIGTHRNFDTYKEAKEWFEDSKKTVVWASFSKITVSGIFKKVYKEEFLDSFSIKDED